MNRPTIREALTFDDILLVPRHSRVHPSEVDLGSPFTRGIRLAIPIVSAAMDTVTEHQMAIALARHGGIGIIHKNMSIEEQAAQVDRVKRSESGMILNPITVAPGARLHEASGLMSEFSISGVPVVEEDGTLVGIITNRDLVFEADLERRVADVMTREGLVTAPEGTSLEGAEEILRRHKIEKLPVVDEEGRLRGLITVKDIFKRRAYPDASKDGHGRLRVGAAVGASRRDLDRAGELVEAGCDVLVVDTAHGHSQGVLDAVARIREALPDVQLVAGNVATKEGARDLADRGVDAVKVGVGPGSICTTRVVTGVGVPQVTAVMDAVEGVDGRLPVISDGGVRHSGDVVKAIAAGASTVMMGSMFAGTDESPGEAFLLEGRRFKVVRGMGSLSAMEEGSADRYFQEGQEARKLVPEGVEGRVPYKGPVTDTIFQLVGGLRSGMGYCGVADIEELRVDARLVKITGGGLRESHPHDVVITREAPNYRV
ncbi:MAG: IMP dehydrogenase [Candidatus Palauibacterales bacterium]|nr:IMP dehydrogenase [Candidatus Palauibacterales bacterium]MDP2528692.1 IMP dehydrogenase [Candidatus Palauibacterales bacterium]MDP2584253.1 IMP dehydrogenase [Candidatus Palauibacterales bacterium]